MSRRRTGISALATLLICCSALFLANPARALCGDEGSGSGGTGLTGSGTGGTGLTNSGTGGTGLTGDEGTGTGGTGIYGTVTAFGSVCLNGLEIEYDDETHVRQDGRNVPSSALRVGQVVHIQTRDRAPMSAARITVETAVGGPVERIDAQTRTLVVMGQTIVLRPGARIFDGPNGPRGLDAVSKGERVSISGLRRPDGTISASRVDPRSDALDVTTGRAVVAGPGAVYIGETRATLRDDAGRTPPARGQLSGRWNAESRTLEVSQARTLPIRPTRAGRFSLEGYANQRPTGLHVQGIAVDLDSVAKPRGGIQTGDRLVIHGSFESDGRLRADRIRVEERRPIGRTSTGAGGERDEDSERSDREDREDREGRSERTDRTERPEREGRVERPERAERPEREGRTGRD